MEQRSGSWQIRESSVPDADTRTRLGRWTVPSRVVVHRSGNPDEPDGIRAPDVVFTLEIRDGAAVCVDVRAISSPGDRGIRQSDLAVNLDALAETHFARWADDDALPFAWIGLEGKEGARREAVGAVDAGHAGTPAAELRHVARIYLDPRNRKRPAFHVEELLDYSHTTTFRKIAAAREAGLIPARGATDEEMTAAYVRLVEGENDGEA